MGDKLKCQNTKDSAKKRGLDREFAQVGPFLGAWSGAGTGSRSGAA